MKLIAIDSSPRTMTLELSNAHSPPPNANRLKGFNSNNAIWICSACHWNSQPTVFAQYQTKSVWLWTLPMSMLAFQDFVWGQLSWVKNHGGPIEMRDWRSFQSFSSQSTFRIVYEWDLFRIFCWVVYHLDVISSETLLNPCSFWKRSCFWHSSWFRQNALCKIAYIHDAIAAAMCSRNQKSMLYKAVQHLHKQPSH